MKSRNRFMPAKSEVPAQQFDEDAEKLKLDYLRRKLMRGQSKLPKLVYLGKNSELSQKRGSMQSKEAENSMSY